MAVFLIETMIFSCEIEEFWCECFQLSIKVLFMPVCTQKDGRIKALLVCVCGEKHDFSINPAFQAFYTQSMAAFYL